MASMMNKVALLCLASAVSWSVMAAEGATPDDQLLPVVYACDAGRARALLDAGANSNHVVKVFLGEQPILLQAVAQDCPAIVQLLLERGADVNGRATGLFLGDTPLIAAAKRGHTEIVNILLRYKPMIDAPGGVFGGETALIVALKEKHREVADSLLERGASVNPRDAFQRTALMSAAMEGNTEMVTVLLSHGADANAKDSVDATALMWAAQNGFLEISRLLLEKKADANAKSRQFNSSVEHWPSGQTALMLAAQHDRLEIVDLLLRHGADRFFKNGDGKSAIDLASSDRVRALLGR
jgi:ankyrin repeat protein